MSNRMTRGEIQDLLAKFAMESSTYRTSLLNDPKSMIEKQLNTELPSHVQVKAMAETANTSYVVVPYVALEGELDDADLEKVAGGFLDKNADCDNAKGAMNTFVQINL